MNAGESMQKSRCVPSSVVTFNGPCTHHPMRMAVATYAAAGPCTLAHWFFADANLALATDISLLSAVRGNHSCQTAIAQLTMGWQCAS